MKQVELCHWLLMEPTGICRSVFAPPGDALDGYVRVGPVARSQQFALPLVYACAPGFTVAELSGQASIRFSLCRDEAEAQGSVFAGMDSLKVASLVSELSSAIAAFVEEVGCEFVAMRLSIDGNFELELKEGKRDRELTLIHAGVAMMAYARGLKCEAWKVVQK